MLRIVERNDDEPGVGADVGIGADDRNGPGAAEDASRIERRSRFKKLLSGLPSKSVPAPTRIRPSNLSTK